MSGIKVTPLRQPNGTTCVHTCISMVTGLSFFSLMERLGDKDGIPFEAVIPVLVEQKIYPIKTTGDRHPFFEPGVYIAGVVSLNSTGRTHCVVIEASTSGYKVHDPNKGRDGMLYYKDEDIVSGKMECTDVYFLDTKILKDLRPLFDRHSDRVPTHYCIGCGARWIDNICSWSLWSESCGDCCDMELMGEQILPIPGVDPKNVTNGVGN